MKELTLRATVGNIPRVTAFIDELLEQAGCSVKAQMQIDVAIDELFGNVAHYAYSGAAGDATVRFALDEDGIAPIQVGGTVTSAPGSRIEVDISKYAGKKGSRALSGKAAILGGVILIAIGIRIFVSGIV